jgi:hypothetical protein
LPLLLSSLAALVIRLNDDSHHARYRLPYIGFMAAIATFVVARQYSIFKDHGRFISNRYASGVFFEEKTWRLSISDQVVFKGGGPG